MQPVTAEVWKLAPVVERFLGYRSTIPLAREQIGVMLTVLAAGGRPVNNFLDLGCGDGILGAAVLSRFPNSKGVLADFSEPMLEIARERLADNASQLSFANIDYADPNWMKAVQADAPFDAIVSGYSIHHQPHKRKRELYAEIFGLLNPGGWFINVEHVAPATPFTTKLFENHVIDTSLAQDQQAGGSKTRDDVAQSFHNRPDKDANILEPVEDQCNWLREIGFTDVDCYFKVYELAVFGGRRSG
jgi:tRNA (cmo5U34)-methyltransferase